MASSFSSQAFQLRLNPLTGESEWVVIQSDSQPPPKALLSNTSYLDMLNDSRRNRAYRLAIEKTITKPSHVLDIGAGTGLLSMMAARTMEKFGEDTGGKVSACESYLPMGKLMRRVLKANGLEKKVKVFHKRSDELQIGIDLDSPADVLVSEILDSELLGEGLIPTLRHAHDNLLVKNPQTVPWRATTYGQLVESPFLWKLHDLYSSERLSSDGIHLTPAGLERIIDVKPQQYALHCNAISKEIRLLSEPFKIFEFDFWRRPESHRQADIWLKATDSGTVNAVISWWVLQLDSEGSIFYSTAPKWISYPNNEMVPTVAAGNGDWCDHWKQCVWFIPGTGLPVLTDKPILFTAVHDETKVSYSLQSDGQTGHDNFSSTECLLELSPERIATYGDRSFRSSLIEAMRNTLNVKLPKLCVIADDSVFLTILVASLSKTSKVISSFPGLQEKGAKYLEAVAQPNGFSTHHIKVIGKRVSHLITRDLMDTKVDMFIGEPFYYGNEAMLPWHYLRFWKERTLLDSILSEDVIIMPCRGSLRICAMSLPDLWRSRCCLKEIEGFDHSMVNETLGACGDLDETQEGPSLPYYIWQCGELEELSSRYSIMDFDFSEPIHSCSGSTKIEFSKTGTCHGFAVWIDWILDGTNSVILSTGPDNRYWKQGVKLLNKPKVIPELGSVVEIEAHFNHESGEVDVNYLFS